MDAAQGGPTARRRSNGWVWLDGLVWMGRSWSMWGLWVVQLAGLPDLRGIVEAQLSSLLWFRMRHTDMLTRDMLTVGLV